MYKPAQDIVNEFVRLNMIRLNSHSVISLLNMNLLYKIAKVVLDGLVPKTVKEYLTSFSG